jgi:cell division protease FtsH
MIITEEEKETTAYHEAGHALVALLLPGTDTVHKVSIIPRGRALGLTQYLPTEEKHTQSKSYLENFLCCLLGGRLAEELVFNEITTGAGNDLERATDLARKMVCEYGMSDGMGPLTYGKKEEQIFLGREIAQHRDFSEHTAVLIDDEVKKFVVAANDKARQLMKDNLKTLKALAESILEKETIDQNDINEVLKASGCTIPEINQQRLDKATGATTPA